ncbi:MAG: TRAP transporter substrate-binding protein [Oscillospiraceae bacterium]|nr:TRAP transporter substrate-binding protein [Oscillospiraceae bacterium]
MKRILSIVLCLVLVASLCAAASADYKPGQFQIKIATVTSGTHPWVQMGDYIAKELNERSNGAIEVTVAPGGQLGNDEATIDDMRLGTLDMVIGGTQNAAPFVSQLQVLSMHYLFPSRDAFEAALVQGGDVFNYIQGKYEEQGLGLHLLGLCNSGRRDMHTTKEVKSLADIKGLKMRVTSSQTESDVWSALGVIPTSMAFNDIYSAAQSNTVSAFECTLSAYNSSALYEVAPYHVATAHQFTPSHVTISDITWNRLPAEFQDLLYEVIGEACLLGNQIADDADDNLLDTLVAEKGVIVCEPDLEEFRSAVEPLWDTIAKNCKGEDFLALIQAQF